MNRSSSTYSPTTNNHALIGVEISIDFTGKVKDSESGYHYFGARYYDSEALTGWLSVDPMADKYPGISPYACCTWNPVKIVDPNGREVYINGGQAEESVKCLQTAKMQVGRDPETGKLSVAFRGDCKLEDLSNEEKMVFEAIACTNITINIQAERASVCEGRNTIRGRDGLRYETFGGAFLGSEYSDEGGEHANTYCSINLELMDFYGNNQLVPHEVSGQFLLGKKTLEGKYDIPLARSDQKNPEYNECHKMAIPQSNYKFHWGRLYVGSKSIWGKTE